MTRRGPGFKMSGIGMAAAVLIDATVVRGVLMPAVLGALGDRAWSLRRRPRPAGSRRDAPGCTG